MVTLEEEHSPDLVGHGTRATNWALVAMLAVVAMMVAALGFLSHEHDVDLGIATYIIVGFLAQIIDGALGMAYGVSSTTFLLSTGVSPAAASASVHTAEVCTTFVSGLSHLKLGNVDKAVFKRLVIPGVIGGVLGAYLLSALPGDKIKPYVSLYLLLMGLRILWKALRKLPVTHTFTHLFPLGVVGGFFDAVGGGGWGPIVTTTLVARGNSPRYTIGSVNLAEFFVTLAEAITFLLVIQLTEYGTVILGLIIGGVLAAPMAAYVCKHLPPRALMVIVGLLIMLLSVRTILMVM